MRTHEVFVQKISSHLRSEMLQKERQITVERKFQIYNSQPFSTIFFQVYSNALPLSQLGLQGATISIDHSWPLFSSWFSTCNGRSLVNIRKPYHFITAIQTPLAVQRRYRTYLYASIQLHIYCPLSLSALWYFAKGRPQCIPGGPSKTSSIYTGYYVPQTFA